MRLFVSAVALLAGCTAASNVQTAPDGSYLITATNKICNSYDCRAPLLRANDEATAFCLRQGKLTEVISVTEKGTEWSVRRDATVTFRCVEKPNLFRDDLR